jgi:hypothetical protein
MKKRGFHMAVLLALVTVIGLSDGLADFYRTPQIEQRSNRDEDDTGTRGATCPACIHEASLRIAGELKEKRFLTGRRVRQLLREIHQKNTEFDELNRHER